MDVAILPVLCENFFKKCYTIKNVFLKWWYPDKLGKCSLFLDNGESVKLDAGFRSINKLRSLVSAQIWMQVPCSIFPPSPRLAAGEANSSGFTRLIYAHLHLLYPFQKATVALVWVTERSMCWRGWEVWGVRWSWDIDGVCLCSQQYPAETCALSCMC